MFPGVQERGRALRGWGWWVEGSVGGVEGGGQGEQEGRGRYMCLGSFVSLVGGRFLISFFSGLSVWWICVSLFVFLFVRCWLLTCLYLSLFVPSVDLSFSSSCSFCFLREGFPVTVVVRDRAGSGCAGLCWCFRLLCSVRWCLCCCITITPSSFFPLFFWCFVFSLPILFLHIYHRYITSSCISSSSSFYLRSN